MRTAVVVFTRDLRVVDNPALARGVELAEQVLPLFVVDDAIMGNRYAAPNRLRFLGECLDDLDRDLRARGGRLVTAHGPWVDEVVRAASASSADTIVVAADVSPFATRRLDALRAACDSARLALEVTATHSVVPPGAVAPAGSDAYQVFTPYWRRWAEAPRRLTAPAPDRVTVPDGSWTTTTVLPSARPTAPDLMPGGRGAAVARLDAWVEQVGGYEAHHDDLPADATSRLSPYLHFGCLSAPEVERAVSGRVGAEPFVRQLCWRDFYAQLLAARPRAAWHDLRPRRGTWNDDPAALAAWQEGRTGYPVVDAGMRQLLREGFMHNRARMIVASFLTKDLDVDWRTGARHFLDHLLDGDIANNNLNWQWVAGTGTDTNPNRIFNPTVQGTRFDPDGEYVRRYVPELAALRGAATHDPDPAVRRAYDYPAPIVDHKEAIAAYRERR